jgi:hypothetical protein
MVIYFGIFFAAHLHGQILSLKSRRISITAAQKRRIFRLRRSWAADFLPY